VSSGHVETVDAFIGCFKRGDREAGARMLSEDCTIYETAGMPHGGTYVGVAGIRRLWALMDELYEHHPEDVEIYDAGPFAVVRQIGHFRARATGASVAMPIVELWWTADNKVTKIEGYYHNPGALRDLADPLRN
jgi:ketosteroid isomerase-like protein